MKILILFGHPAFQNSHINKGMIKNVKTRNWSHTHEMLEMGIEGVHREYLDSALRRGARALKIVGLHQYQIQRALKLFQKHDERMVLELSQVRHEKKAFIRGSRRRIEKLI